MEIFITVALLAAGGYFLYRALKSPKAKGGGSADSDPTRPRYPDK